MDKTIEVLVVAVIAVIAAVIIIALLTGQTDVFDEFVGGQSQDAECRLAQTQYENGEITESEAGDCYEDSWDTPTEDDQDSEPGTYEPEPTPDGDQPVRD